VYLSKHSCVRCLDDIQPFRWTPARAPARQTLLRFELQECPLPKSGSEYLDNRSDLETKLLFCRKDAWEHLSKAAPIKDSFWRVLSEVPKPRPDGSDDNVAKNRRNACEQNPLTSRCGRRSNARSFRSTPFCKLASFDQILFRPSIVFPLPSQVPHSIYGCLLMFDEESLFKYLRQPAIQHFPALQASNSVQLHTSPNRVAVLSRQDGNRRPPH